MKAKKIEQNILTAVFLLFVLVFMVKSFNYSHLDRRIVLFFGVPVSIMLVLLMLADNFPRFSGFKIRAKFFGAVEGIKLKKEAKPVEEKKAWQVIASIFFFFILMNILGLLSSIPIFTFLYLKFFSKESWAMSLSLSFGIWLMIYVSFVMWLGLPM